MLIHKHIIIFPFNFSFNFNFAMIVANGCNVRCSLFANGTKRNIDYIIHVKNAKAYVNPDIFSISHALSCLTCCQKINTSINSSPLWSFFHQI